MTTQRTLRLDLGWRRKNLAALLVLSVAMAAGAIAAAASPRLWNQGGQVPLDIFKIRAGDEIIDPNTASQASLMRLPRLGPARSQEILRYRQSHGPRAFRRLQDLEKVRGIGPATLELIQPHLFFPPRDVSH